MWAARGCARRVTRRIFGLGIRARRGSRGGQGGRKQREGEEAAEESTRARLAVEGVRGSIQRRWTKVHSHLVACA